MGTNYGISLKSNSPYILDDFTKRTGTPFITKDKYIITVDTTREGTSTTSQFTLPAVGSNFRIEWFNKDNLLLRGEITGDGETTISFPEPGNYVLLISGGTFSRINFNNGGDAYKLSEINQWGSIVWSSMESAYYGCEYMDMPSKDIPDLSQCASLSRTFQECTRMGGVGVTTSLPYWNISTITNLFSCFDNRLNQTGTQVFNQNIRNWDTSNVTNMSQMFYYCSTFNGDIGNWNVSNVENMSSMFRNCSSFRRDLSAWDVSNVKYFNTMFWYSGMDNSINVSCWDMSSALGIGFMFGGTSFNDDISGWNVSNVTSMNYMFSSNGAFNQDITGWNTSKVVDMNSMFVSANSFDQDISLWNFNSLNNSTRLNNLFLNATGLSVANYDKLLVAWSGAADLGTLLSPQSPNMGGSQYTAGGAAEAARNHLVNTHLWAITDGGPV